MTLYHQLPGMVRAMLTVLLADWAAVVLFRSGLGGVAVILYILGSVVAFWGGLEAVHWVLRSSPWVRLLRALAKEMEEPRPDVIEAQDTRVDTWLSLFRDLPLDDRPELRRGLLRLLSGAAMAFLLVTLAKWALPARLPGMWQTLLLTLDLERVRLVHLAVGAGVFAPLLALLLGREEPPRGGEWLHVVLATVLSAASWVILYPEVSPPGFQKYLEFLVQCALDPAGIFYGLMVGGVFWWKIGLAGAVMGRRPPG